MQAHRSIGQPTLNQKCNITKNLADPGATKWGFGWLIIKTKKKIIYKSVKYQRFPEMIS